MADPLDRMRAESDWLKAELTLRAEIERLRKERDEARREVCSLQPYAHHNDGIAKDHAAYRGWDCFKENTND